MKTRTNTILEDNWTWLLVDVSTPRFPGKHLKIDTEDWNWLLALNKLGRVRASDWNSAGNPYPSAKLRGKDHSLLFILFRSPRAVRCAPDPVTGEVDKFDLRRSNLRHGGGDGSSLVRVGEEGWSKASPPAAERKVFNRTLGSAGKGHILLDVSTNAHPDKSIRVASADLERALASGAGRIHMKRMISGELAPYCTVPDNHAPRGRREKMLLKVIHGPEAAYATGNFANVGADNVRPRAKIGARTAEDRAAGRLTKKELEAADNGR